MSAPDPAPRRYALKPRPFPAACMVGYTVMRSWLMFGVMGKY